MKTKILNTCSLLGLSTLSAIAWILYMGSITTVLASDSAEVSTASAALWNVEGGVNRGPDCSARLAQEETPDKQAAIQFHYQFDGVLGEATYVVYHYKKADALPSVPKRLSAWIKGNGQQLPLAVRFRGPNGTWFLWRAGKIDWDGWKKVNFDLSANRPGYSGWKEGEPATRSFAVVAPIQFGGLTFDKRMDGDASAGDILIGGIVIEY